MYYFIYGSRLVATLLFIIIFSTEFTVAKDYQTLKQNNINNMTTKSSIQKEQEQQNSYQKANQNYSQNYNNVSNADTDFIHSYFTPTFIGFASYLLPGTGQLMNGESAKAALHASLYYALNREQEILKSKSDYNNSINYFSDERIMYRTKTMQTYFTLETLTQQEKSYSAFDAFRTARRINQEHGVIYIQPVTNESFTELALAPFDYHNLLQPLVFLPILAVSLTAFSNTKSDPYADDYKDNIINNDNYISPTNNRDLNYMYGTTFVDAMSVGFGEETLFRGFLFPAFTELSGNMIWGGFLSSALFGMMHSGVGSQAKPLEAFASGSYFAFLSYYNDFKLGPSIALHSWWDTLLMLSVIKKNKSNLKFDRYGRPIKETYKVASIGFMF